MQRIGDLFALEIIRPLDLGSLDGSDPDTDGADGEASAPRKNYSPTAPDTAGADKVFQVTHPFHPLYGRKLELVLSRHNWREQWASFYDDRGRLVSLPASWTSLGDIDPFKALSNGCSLFRPVDLLLLVELIEGIKDAQSSCKAPGGSHDM